MARVIAQLTNGKPLVDVTIVDALPKPQEVSATDVSSSFNIKPYRALLDTGADMTCLCDHVVQECQLRQSGFVRMVGAVGPSLHQTHIVRIGILTGNMSEIDDTPRGIFQLEPMEAAAIRNNDWFDLIIGTDVLSQHELTFRRGGRFELTLF